MSPRDRRLALVLAALVLGAALAALWQRPLFEPDEGRYAEIPREMLASGDFVLPHLDGLEYLEKPPLEYWAGAGALALFGRTPFAARLYGALCALGTLIVVGLLARRLAGRAAALRAVCVLASMLLFVALGQLLSLDMSLTFWMTVALAAFLAAQQAARASPGERAGMLIAWGATALGVLTKGLEAAVIPAAVLVLYTLLTREARPWRRLHPVAGLALFALLAVPWFVAVARREPKFLEFFFVHEHFSRYLTPSADRVEPVWFFGPVLLWGTVPWTLAALRALVTGWRASPAAPGADEGVAAAGQAAAGKAATWSAAGLDAQPLEVRRFLVLWVLFVLGFFSLSDSKLIPYILPALPPLALLVALLPEAAWRDELDRTGWLTLLAAALAAALALLGPRHLAATPRNACFAALAPALLEVAALLALTGLYVRVLSLRAAARSTLLLAAGWCLAALVLARAASAVAPIYSGIELVRALPAVPAAVPVYSVGTYDQTLPFYWNRTVTLVHYRGELDFGLTRAGQAELSIPEFIERWQGAPAAYAVMEQGAYEALVHQGVPMRQLGRDVRRVLVARR